MKMLLVLIAVMATGCEGAAKDAAKAAQSVATQTTSVDGDGVVPVPVPTAPGAPPKALLSAWARSDGRFTVNLSTITNLTVSPGVSTGERALFVFTATVTCSTIVSFNGTESLGSVAFTSSRSTIGSQSANDRYCNPLEGTYDYAMMSGNILRLCRSGACQYWQ